MKVERKTKEDLFRRKIFNLGNHMRLSWGVFKTPKSYPRSTKGCLRGRIRHQFLKLPK